MYVLLLIAKENDHTGEPAFGPLAQVTRVEAQAMFRA